MLLPCITICNSLFQLSHFAYLHDNVQATNYLFKYESHPHEHQYGGHSAITEISTKVYPQSFQLQAYHPWMSVPERIWVSYTVHGISYDSVSHDDTRCAWGWRIVCVCGCWSYPTPLKYPGHGRRSSLFSVWFPFSPCQKGRAIANFRKTFSPYKNSGCKLPHLCTIDFLQKY